MNELEKFVKLSKYAGERFDLVQAGGGNSSVKLSDGSMIIKASGFLLSEMDTSKGYSKVDNARVISIMKNKELLTIADKKEKDSYAKNLMDEAIIDSQNRPSIETFLHALLDTYTLHTHPLLVNIITAQADWEDQLNKLFENCLMIKYKTPGIELASELNSQLESYINAHNIKPKIVFLQNHGLIVSARDDEEVIALTEVVLDKIEQYLAIDQSRYKLTTKISSLVNSLGQSSKIAYLSDDRNLCSLLESNKKSFFSKPFCPDKLVYCGISAVELQDISSTGPLIEYKHDYFELPRVIIYKENIFLIADTVKKAKEIEDVLKFHLLVMTSSKNNPICLEEKELMYLGNWEAEKYRQTI
ncbi:MAG: hypothetical protein DKM50_02665 [Candidatus Margulisiibacteriota bacterium]|nr:MAG: hypothetical protein A2X43_03560 [Candidatus Margulisbacteria bacterium GWD2_39_127]OGI02510.1 MAG: hypothetical protein A2X42_07485 [Candidatus Margulisbacteria bacterium GWF2_38_17]OGI11003.1 MAG: hypothetical protein A2X41_02010 [Candidatus Margulisbacteria bacterium GWE2_39_32]PZM83195.1 MAG: hypothetical protein DKM50_02665 [Candidatus Margulisiibacteriota bacterium]HAR62500.1 hypothetical protein [Candidatus Margulisiibacteriota bacterium]